MKDTLEEMIVVLTAFKDGKKIEVSRIGENDWGECENPKWDWNINNYRIAAEPEYRPYADTSEMINDFCERFGVKKTVLLIWVKLKINNDFKSLITDFNSGYIFFSNKNEGINMNTLFSDYEYLDGSPCGILVK